MYKDRLEEIKRNFEVMTSEEKEYLIEQAERVQELERQLKVSNSVHADDRKLLNRRTKQNKRYREWLEKIECNTSGEENLMARKALAGEDLADYDG